MKSSSPHIGWPELPSRPGSYVLWLRLDRARRVRVGSLGLLCFAAGYYGYVGSALGPGGLASRLGRHLGVNKRLRWHIDYLRRVSEPVAIWCSCDPRRYEHRWAEALAKLPGARHPASGFGSSDCACRSHLIGFTRRPPPRAFLAQAGGSRVAVINRICE